LQEAKSAEREANAEEYGDGTPQPCWHCGEKVTRMPTRWNEIANGDMPDAWRCEDCWRCEGCGAEDPEPNADEQTWTGHSRRFCDDCWSNEAERLAERAFEDYHGGTSPLTPLEQQQRAKK